MRRIALSIAALLLAASSAEAAPWQTYTFRDQGFAIESLVPLAKGTGQYRGAIAGRLQTVTYSGEAENIRYKVSILDISKRLPEAVNLYEEMESLTSLGGKVLANESVGIEPGAGRHYGRQLVMQMKDGSHRSGLQQRQDLSDRSNRPAERRQGFLRAGTLRGIHPVRSRRSRTRTRRGPGQLHRTRREISEGSSAKSSVTASAPSSCAGTGV